MKTEKIYTMTKDNYADRYTLSATTRGNDGRYHSASAPSGMSYEYKDKNGDIKTKKMSRKQVENYLWGQISKYYEV